MYRVQYFHDRFGWTTIAEKSARKEAQAIVRHYKQKGDYDAIMYEIDTE